MNNNNKYKITMSKRRRNRKATRRYRLRRRRFIQYTAFGYQYSSSMQSMGPGTTVKNFEKRETITANTEIALPLSAFANEGDLDSSFRQYRYFKVVSIAITQNNMNLTNEQRNCYVRIAWSNNYEEQQDIEKDDATKILPNIGRKLFIFRPPNAQLPITINSQKYCLNMSHFQPTEALLDPIGDSYKIPGSVSIFNDTTQGRYITMILRIIFRGNKVIDSEAESRRILSRKGYIIIKANKEIENKNEDEKVKEKEIIKENNSENKKENKNENEEEEYEDEEDQISKWSQTDNDIHIENLK